MPLPSSLSSQCDESTKWERRSERFQSVSSSRQSLCCQHDGRSNHLPSFDWTTQWEAAWQRIALQKNLSWFQLCCLFVLLDTHALHSTVCMHYCFMHCYCQCKHIITVHKYCVGQILIPQVPEESWIPGKPGLRATRSPVEQIYWPFL